MDEVTVTIGEGETTTGGSTGTLIIIAAIIAYALGIFG